MYTYIYILHIYTYTNEREEEGEEKELPEGPGGWRWFTPPACPFFFFCFFFAPEPSTWGHFFGGLFLVSARNLAKKNLHNLPPHPGMGFFFFLCKRSKTHKKET